MMEISEVLKRSQVELEREEPFLEYCSKDLPEEAASLLGYEPFLMKKRRVKFGNVLRELDILPFDSFSIENHKNSLSKKSQFCFFSLLDDIFYPVSIIGWLLCLGPAVLGWFLSWEIGLYFLVILILCLIMWMFLENRRDAPLWKVIPLKECGWPVPKFVIEDALQIKQRVPDVEFYVHYFFNQKSLIISEMLVARYGRKDYFIDVWRGSNFLMQKEV